MLLPWGQTTVLGHLVAQWRSVGARQIGVVCAREDQGVSSELDRIGMRRDERIMNAEPARGMFSSIQCAARWDGWNSTLTHWAIALGDQPHLANETLEAIAAFSANHPDTICQPARNTRPRHPVFLPRPFFEELARTHHVTLKEFLKVHTAEVRLLEIDDTRLDLDLDTPADYERAQGEFRKFNP